MIRLTIKGEPTDIAKLFAFLEDSDEIDLEWNSRISKRSPSDKWGSAIAGIDIDYPVAEASPEIVIYEKKKGKAAKADIQPGHVYVLPAYGKRGLIAHKIGKSRNLHSRRHNFGLKLNFEIEYLIIISSDDFSALEKQLHGKYKNKRRGASEWFNLDETDLKELEAMMSNEDRIYLERLNREINPYANE